MKRDSLAKNEIGPTPSSPDFHKNSLKSLSEIPGIIVRSGVNTDFAIDEILAKIGILLGASRAYIMQDEKDGCYLRNTHEWVDQNIGPAMFSWPLYDYEYDLPSLKNILESEPVFFSAVRDLPPDMNQVLSKQGVKSLLLAPLYRDGVRIGLVGLDFCDAERQYLEEFASIITFLTGLISIALERKQYQVIRNKLNKIRLAIADVEPILTDEEAEEVPQSRPSRPVTLVDAERRIIIETLELYNGNKLKTAKHLGLTWPSLDRRCKKMGIEVRKR